jgi:hypothetical protein
MNKKCLLWPLIVLGLLISVNCSRKSQKGEELKSYPLNSLDGVIAQSSVTFDRDVSYDGQGSVRIEAGGPMTVPLFEISDVKVENAVIFYRARVRTERVIGQVYLEMLCHFPDKGEYISRGQATLLTGTNDWTFQETPFLLRQGESPDLVKLNLVIDGRGTAWIDDISLTKGAR